MSNSNNEQIEQLLNTLAQKLGKSPQELKQSAESKDFAGAFDNLNPKDAEKIKNVLSNKEATNKILSTPKAQQLLSKILGDK